MSWSRWSVIGAVYVAVLLRSAQGQSKPPTVTELPKSSNRYAILVGIGKYSDPNIAPLSDPPLDVRALQQVLEKSAGFYHDNIVVLSDEPSNIEPTRANILGELSKIKNSVSGDSLLLLMFAGHGIVRGDKVFVLSKDARLTQDVQYLSDTSISVDTLRTYIAATQVKQAIVLLDTCRDDPMSSHGVGTTNALSDKFTDAFDFDKYNQDIQASAVIYATDVGYRAWVDPRRQLGYFTEVLADGLDGKAADRSGNVTLSGIVAYLQDTVPALVSHDLAQHQKPTSDISGYKANELVLSTASPTVPLSVVDSSGHRVTIDAANTPNPPPPPNVPDPASLASLRNATYDFDLMFENYKDNESALANLGEDAFLKGNYAWTIKYLERARVVQSSQVWMDKYPYLAAAYLLGNNDQVKFRATLDDMVRDMSIPNTYLHNPGPIAFTLPKLITIRRLVPEADRNEVDDVVARVRNLSSSGSGLQGLRTSQVCSFHGEAPHGGQAWLKQDSCIIPDVEHLDAGYRQQVFECCGGGAESPTTAANIPAGLELKTTGSVYWSVANPILNSDKFSLTTYCGPSAAFLGSQGCSVDVTVVAHYRY
jgi:hypothetical protein